MATIEERNKAIVRKIYEESSAGDIDALVNAMHEDFEELVPPMLPWGGVHRGPDVHKTKPIPLLAAALDLSSLRLISLTTHGDRVAALSSARSALRAVSAKKFITNE
jgi:ketosteroid isomerase-like protein